MILVNYYMAQIYRQFLLVLLFSSSVSSAEHKAHQKFCFQLYYSSIGGWRLIEWISDTLLTHVVYKWLASFKGEYTNCFRSYSTSNNVSDVYIFYGAINVAKNMHSIGQSNYEINRKDWF